MCDSSRVEIGFICLIAFQYFLHVEQMLNYSELCTLVVWANDSDLLAQHYPYFCIMVDVYVTSSTSMCSTYSSINFEWH